MNQSLPVCPAAGKTIFLVRHAESTNNVSKRTAGKTLGEWKWPTWQQWKTMAPMVTFPMNTELSEEGQKQVERQADTILKDGFVARENPELIVHSPLHRAKATCVGLFSGYVVPIEEHPDLYEKSLGEHFAQRTGVGTEMTPRVDEFTSWLQLRKEKVIVVVVVSTKMSGSSTRAMYSSRDPIWDVAREAHVVAAPLRAGSWSCILQCSWKWKPSCEWRVEPHSGTAFLFKNKELKGEGRTTQNREQGLDICYL
jgi:hypothetical protein